MAIQALEFLKSKMNSQEASAEGKQGLNAFYGVFLPSLLSIFGVIMYLRLGTVVGSLGIFGTFFIVIFSSLITLITAFSISATATNSHVGSGGAYYMISRAFGIEIGSAIGVALFLAQVIGLAFYIEGFSESLLFLFPSLDAFTVEGTTLFCLAALTVVSSNAALKTQLLILFLILGSLASVFFGRGASVEPSPDALGAALPFWAAFALFFPAVTGIEAGFSMSGDLKNAKKALPIGTIAAVITGLVVYLILSWFLWSTVSSETLLKDPMILLHMSGVKALVILGIWGATLSSAIGALLGAPRTLQALAKDGIAPKFLSRCYGEAKEPRNAAFVTFVIAALCLFFGNINIIAPVLAMFFLISYGMLNLASGIESFLENPSWRPTFSTPWYISFTGAGLCLFAMLMIDAGATFIALFIVGMLYLLTTRKNLSKEWEDIHQGTLLFFARFAIYRLASQETSVRSWRPNFLVFSRSPSHRPDLMRFAASITNNKGFMTTATVLPTDNVDYDKEQHMQGLIREYLKKRKILSLVEVTSSQDLLDGMKKIITGYGLGPIVPNTIVMGYSYKEQNLKRIVDLIFHAASLDKSLILLKDVEEEIERPSKKIKEKVIDIWWDDKCRRNNDLMLVLAYMLQGAPEWKAHELTVKCVVPNENAREMRLEHFSNFFSDSRLDVEPKVLVVPEESENSPKTIPLFSSNSDYLFVGLRSPESMDPDAYASWLAELVQAVKSIPKIAFVLNSNDISLKKIFS